jgi:5-methylcytosine-specific restriction endonuclease McrA
MHLNQSLITLDAFSIEEILPHINDFDSHKTYMVLSGYNVNKSSHRLACFKKNLKCVSCFRVGIIFLLQIQKTRRITSPKTPHLNLYAADGTMMTRDHIIPLSKGGGDGHDNSQTMCEDCNRLKGNISPEVYERIKHDHGLLKQHRDGKISLV